MTGVDFDPVSDAQKIMQACRKFDLALDSDQVCVLIDYIDALVLKVREAMPYMARTTTDLRAKRWVHDAGHLLP